LDVLENDFCVINCSAPGTAYYNVGYFIEYINESSNVINSVINYDGITELN
jgi:hypothetical protein